MSLKWTRLGLLVIVPLLALPFPALSDEGDADHHQESAVSEEMIQRMQGAKEELGLTDEQAAQVREILSENAKQMAAVFEKHGVDRDNPPKSLRKKRALAKDLKPIRKAGDEKLAQVLDADQMKKLEEMREQVKKEMKQRRKQGG